MGFNFFFDIFIYFLFKSAKLILNLLFPDDNSLIMRSVKNPALFYDQSFKKNSHILKREKKDKRTNLLRQVRTTKKENENNNLQPCIAHPI